MIQIIRHQWKIYSRRLLLLCAIAASLIIVSDSTYFEPIESREPITAPQIASSCSPSKIINLENINISVGSSWKIGHSYYCLGYPHVVTTINRVGILHIDKIVSHAIVLNYAWILRQTENLDCKSEVKKIEPYVVDKKGGILFAAYILDCKEI